MLRDTGPAMEKRSRERTGQPCGAERLEVAARSSSGVRAVAEAGLRRRHPGPDLDVDEVALRRAARERSSWIAVCLPSALLLLASCSASPPPAADDARRYTVRGEVVQAPAPVAAGTQVLVRHEAIDDFVDSSGRITGMDAMVMPFDVAPPLSATDLAVGDKVEIRFSMDWKGPRLRVERIERLPPGTALRFGPARAAGK
jgi:Cu/Ag efflux protein CusF